METIGFYAFASVVIAIPVGLIFFAARRAHRVCKLHTWTRVTSLGFAFVYLFVTLTPYAIYGSQWAMVWFYLAMPFSVVLEIIAPLGFSVFALITTTIAASFWGALLYVLSAIILIFRGRAAARVRQ
jgi:hypothetical protein